MNRNSNSNFTPQVLTKNSWTQQIREYFRSFSQKVWTQKKKFLWLVAIALSPLSYFLFRVGKNYSSPSKPTGEEKSPELGEVEEEIFSATNFRGEISEEKVVAETNHSGLDPAVVAYYQRIIANIHSGNIHGEVITPRLRNEAERTNNTPYLLCSVPTCQWTTARVLCPHNYYFQCPKVECSFSSRESYCYRDYCDQHTCQRCQQLVVIYADNYGEKYCSNCLPKTVADYQSPNF